VLRARLVIPDAISVVLRVCDFLAVGRAAVPAVMRGRHARTSVVPRDVPRDPKQHPHPNPLPQGEGAEKASRRTERA
jgi:hypothetical protein